MATRLDLLKTARPKLQPKLQMIVNGDDEVNTVRSQRCAALAATSEKQLRDSGERRVVLLEQPKRFPKVKKLKQIARDIEANVFIHLNVTTAPTPRILRNYLRQGRIIRARVPLSGIPQLVQDPSVTFVEIGESLKFPQPKLSALESTSPKPSDRRFGAQAQHKFGEDILIGIVDVQGFDFSHPDFLDEAGRTRFVAIWDQGGDARVHPDGKKFDYGAEFTKKHLNDAIKAAPRLGVPAYEVERQSQMAEGSHGTHVASIAAGNLGVCRRASIAGVLISLPQDEAEDRRRSFYDSTRIADAVDYLVDLAESLGKKAVSINISLGTNGHAHDGSGAVGRYLDAVLTSPGRSVTVAAGNAGQEIGESPEDFGWMMGRIHTSGRVMAADLTRDIEWVVVGNGVIDASENELELWFSPQDSFEVSLQLPSGEWTEAIGPREYIENRQLSDGSFLSVYNEVHHPSNGANYVAIYLSPTLKADPLIGVLAGTWTVRLRGVDIRDGNFHGWIERDDPQRIGPVGDREAWTFPSFFTKRSTVDDSTVNSLGCGNRVITVANLDLARNRINISSSQGPSRDGRTKPDIAAPGTDIMAAKGFSTNNERWIGMTGTSMAAPYVTGVIGLMLAIEPKLTSAQIEGILRSTAKPLPGASFIWVNDAGFGVIAQEDCLREALNINRRKDRTEKAP
jgi:subtilisin family serine protease